MLPMLRMLALLSLAFVWNTGHGLVQVAAAATPDSLDGMVLAQKSKSKKNKKKKKNSSSEMDFGPGGVDAITEDGGTTGTGIHRLQARPDAPYFIEAAGTTSFTMLSSKVGGENLGDTTEINIGGELLFIFGQIEAGPAISYFTSTITSETPSFGEDGFTTTTSEIKSSGYNLGGVFKYNFGDIHRSDFVAFVHAGFGLISAEDQENDESLKRSGHVIRFGGGVNIFLDSNVALQPRGEYRMQSTKAEGASDNTETTGFNLVLAVATFL